MSELLGRAVSWLVLILAVCIVSILILRHGFGVEFDPMRETAVWLNALIVLLSASYTLLHDGHTRVSVLYHSKSPRVRTLIDILGVLFFLLPFVVGVAWLTWPYVYTSWQALATLSIDTVSIETLSSVIANPVSLVVRSLVLFFCVTLGLQGVILAARSLKLFRALAPRARS